MNTMYEILIDGEVVQTTQYPNWVKWVAPMESWVVCEYDDAEAILIYVDSEEEQTQIYANIAGKPVARQEFPTATIREVTEA